LRAWLQKAFAAIEIDQPRYGLEQGGLPASAAAHDGREPARLEYHVEAVEHDPIVVGEALTELRRLTVDEHASGADPVFDLAPRTQARLRQGLVDAGAGHELASRPRG